MHPTVCLSVTSQCYSHANNAARWPRD